MLAPEGNMRLSLAAKFSTMFTRSSHYVCVGCEVVYSVFFFFIIENECLLWPKTTLFHNWTNKTVKLQKFEADCRFRNSSPCRRF